MAEYVLVIWGETFDEIAATIFVGECRRAGLRTKLVGLSHRQAAGLGGLTLVPDMLLSEALPLASRSVAIILPCGSEGLQRLSAELRLVELVRQGRSSGAKVVSGTESFSDPFAALLETAQIYPDHERLVVFARALAQELLGWQSERTSARPR